MADRIAITTEADRVTTTEADRVTAITVADRVVITVGAERVAITEADRILALAPGGGYTYADGLRASDFTAIGDLLVGSASGANGILGVGTDGYALVADSSEALGMKWSSIGTGDVVGPASATDNAIATYDGATGKLLQNTAVQITPAGNITLAGTVDGRDLSTDGTKLDGIEALADVTDATNVNAAGAVMETDYTTKGDLLAASAASTPTVLAIGINGRVLTADSAAPTGMSWSVPTPAAHAASHTDGTDDIQDATAGQKGLATAAQITKLDGIEALADVTDATNVAAALAAATGSLDLNAQAITNVGTVDGRDVSADGATLDALGTNALVDADWTAKGALMAADGVGSPTVQAVGLDGYVLSANSAQATGLQWVSLAGKDTDAIHDNVAGEIQAIADTAIAAGDRLVFEDATDSWNKKSDTVQGIIDLVTDVGAFATASNVTSNSPGTLATDDFVFGSDTLDDAGNPYHDSRFLFDKSHSSFRAGKVLGTLWDAANRGAGSAAFGSSNGSGQLSMAWGSNCLATASYATAGGNNSTASGFNSLAIGDVATATNTYAVALGRTVVADHYGEMAHAAGAFSVSGDAQHSDVIWRKTTNDATANVELYLDGSSQRLTVASDTTYLIDILLVARRTDVAGDRAAYRLVGMISNDAGTTALDYAVSKTVLHEDDTSWDCQASADNANDTLKLDVTGAAGKTIRWVAHGRIAKVAG